MRNITYFLSILCFFVGSLAAQADDTHGTKGWLLTADEINDGGITVFLHIDCQQKQAYVGSTNHTTGYTERTNDFYVEKVKGGIILKNVETNQYIKVGNGNTVSREDNKANATVFKAVQTADPSINNLHTDALPAPQSVRIAVASSLSSTPVYLNSSGGSQSILVGSTGIGCWSVFYVYESYREATQAKHDDTQGAKGTLLTADEINRGGFPVFLHIDCDLRRGYAASGNHTDNYTAEENDFFLEKADGGVKLKNMHSGEYICGTSGPATRSSNSDQATVFKAMEVTDNFDKGPGNGLHADAEDSPLAVRFLLVDASSTLYLNSSGGSPVRTNFTYTAGTGNWSIYYVYAKALPVSLTETSNLGHAATFSAGWNTEASEGINTYKIAETTDNEATLEQTNGNIIPKNEGIILNSNSETTAYMYYTSSRGGEEVYAGNLLVGLPEGGKPKTAEGETAYVFTKGDGDAAIFRQLDTNGNDFSANKACLVLNEQETAALAIRLGGMTTGIDRAADKTESNAPKYDLSGRRVTNVARGSLYIQSGKTYIAR